MRRKMGITRGNSSVSGANAPETQKQGALAPAGHVGQGVANFRQASDGADACVLQRGKFIVSSTLTTSNNRTGMTHALSGRRGDTRDIANYRLGHMRLDVGSGLFFSIAADLTHHHNGFGRRIFLEQL